MQKAKIISIEVSEAGEGLFHATSPQIEALFVTGESAEQAIQKVPEAIEGLYALDGLKVDVVPAENDDLPIPQPWVILGTESRRAAC